TLADSEITENRPIPDSFRFNQNRNESGVISKQVEPGPAGRLSSAGDSLGFGRMIVFSASRERQQMSGEPVAEPVHHAFQGTPQLRQRIFDMRRRGFEIPALDQPVRFEPAQR